MFKHISEVLDDMARNMSFALTTEQIINETKTVTRRFGWWFLQPGQKIWAVEKSMGLKKGEKIKRLKLIEVVSTRRERLRDITSEDVTLEGFPTWSTHHFVKMLMNHYDCHPDDEVNRIAFKYVK